MATKPSNSKLEVYKIILNSEKNHPFRRFVSDRIELEDSFYFLEIFKMFITELDKKAYHKTKKNKAITATNSKNSDHPPVPDSRKFVIEGIIRGGKFGKKRSMSNVDDKEEHGEVKKNNVINDDYYFFLHLPIDMEIGVLIIQSFSSDTITDAFIDFISNLFTKEIKGFKKPSFEKFVPKSIIEDFKRHSTIQKFNYTSNFVSGHLESKEIQRVVNEFKVSIIIDIKKGVPNTKFKEITDFIGNLSFLGNIKKELKNFDTGKVTIKDNIKNTTTSFDIESDFDIKPVIYLDEKDVNFDEDNLPTRDSLKSLCYRLLEQIEKEIYPSRAIR